MAAPQWKVRQAQASYPPAEIKIQSRRFLYLKEIRFLHFDEIKEVYGDDAPSYDVIKHWNRQFKCGRTSVETAAIHGRQHPATDVNTIHKMVVATLEDHRITIRQLAQEVKISVGSVGKIIYDHLNMRKLSVRWILRMLTVQKQE
ncbi:protein GVQW3-like [Octopus sinensis]|uniref:Protein GVQW3-like n=1 Tax=Octopus sinensis TaxID=2607531 RepID=A0A6P7TIW6_9MOLL|nr:protein GVQW3-like [Octopus sinensis]